MAAGILRFGPFFAFEDDPLRDAPDLLALTRHPGQIDSSQHLR
jgi:hypothetical protein